MSSAPIKLQANELLKQHGPTGWLIRRLQRYALTGWIAFFALLVVFVMLIFLSTFAPRPVVAVDEGGHVLGNLEYITPSSRTDAEILAGAQHFLANYLSLNSSTIFEDYSAALNIMTPDLRDQTLAAIKQSGYLGRVQKANTRSRLAFGEDGDRPRVTERDGLAAQVRLKGNMLVYGADNKPTAQPFDMTLTVSIVARTTKNTQGLQIAAIKDN